LNSRRHFRPGTQSAPDLGHAHPWTDRASGLLQLNEVVKRRDRGGEAEPADSGGPSLFLSPGLSYKLRESMRLYGYYQHPLYQYVNGVQLTAARRGGRGIYGVLIAGSRNAYGDLPCPCGPVVDSACGMC
jgi:hypothetical protein